MRAHGIDISMGTLWASLTNLTLVLFYSTLRLTLGLIKGKPVMQYIFENANTCEEHDIKEII